MDGAGEISLVVIATMITLQTVAMLAVAIIAVKAGRKLAVDMDKKYQSLAAVVDRAAATVDKAVEETRDVAASVNRLSDRASDALDDAGTVFRSVASVVVAPKAAMVLGSARVAKSLLARWRRPGAQRSA